jgi:hypothetical protein
VPLDLDETTITANYIYMMHPKYADWDPSNVFEVEKDPGHM